MKSIHFQLFFIASIFTNFCLAQASQSAEFIFSGTADWYAKDLALTQEGHLLQLILQHEGGYDKAILLSTDTLGQLNWIREWGKEEEILRPEKLLVQPNGEIIVVATYFNPFQGGAEIALLHLQSDGSLLDQHIYASLNSENIRGLLRQDNGNILLLGDVAAGNGIATLLLEIDTDGLVLRQMTIKKDLYTYYTHLYASPDGGVFLSGQNNLDGQNNGIISRLDANWNVMWTSESSRSGTQVLGYDIIAVDDNFTSQQLVRYDSDLWLVERNDQGAVIQERWLGVSGEPMGYSVVADNFLVSTFNGGMASISDQFEILAVQYRSSDIAGPSTHPVLVGNNSLITIGHTLNENNQFVIVQQQGAAALAPGCVGYYAAPIVAPIESGLNHTLVTPTIGSSSFSRETLDLDFTGHPNPLTSNSCTTTCSGPPAAGFTVAQNGLSIDAEVSQALPDTDYEWQVSTGENYNGSNLEFTFLSEGQYELCLLASNSCGQTQSCQTINLTINAVRELEALPLSLSPNPATDRVDLRGFKPGFYQLRIFNISGKLIASDEKYFSGESLISTTSWSAGCYQIQLINEKEMYVARLIKSAHQ